MNIFTSKLMQKVFVVTVLLFFIVPIATAFCCCKSEDGHHQEKSVAQHGHGEHDHHQQSPEPSHHQSHGQNGCECGLENIAADATIPTIHFFQSDNSVVQWFDKSFTLNQGFSEYKSTSSYSEGESPPGNRFLSTPLYLQLQTLRI